MAAGLRTAVVVPGGTAGAGSTGLGTEPSIGDLLDLASAVEAAGFDGLFVRPHPADAGVPGRDASLGRDPLPGRDRLPGRDPFVLLGAISVRCQRLQLGAMIPAGSRPAGVLAKAVASLDVCSHGRAIHLLAPPPTAFPTADPSTAALPTATPESPDRLAEEIEASRLMLRRPAPSFDGLHVHLRQAWNEPLARRADPTPVGLVLPLGGRPAPAGESSGDASDLAEESPDLARETAQQLAVAGKFCDLVVIELGPLTAGAAHARLHAASAALAAGAAPAASAGRDNGPPRRLLVIEPTGTSAASARACFEDPALGCSEPVGCSELCDGVVLSWQAGAATSIEELVSWRRLAEAVAQGSGSSSSSAR